MRTKEILSIIIAITLLLFIPSIVNATTNEILEDDNVATTEEVTEEEETKKETNLEWTDVTNCKISVVTTNLLQHNDYKIKLEGFEKKQGSIYYCFVTNTDKEPELVLDSMGFVTNPTSNILEIYMDEYFEKNEDIYYWICEEQKNNDTGKREQKFIIEAKKFERPKQYELGKRMKGSFDSENSSIFLNEPHDTDNVRNIKVKIGKITNNSILLSIKNGEAKCLEKLLEYAKKSDAIYTGKLKLGIDNNTITDKIEIIDDAYYYVYLEMDDENGKYYPVEDVSLYQGLVGETVGKNLYDYLSDEFKWNIVEENKNEKPDTEIKDTTTAEGTIPQTGENITIFIVIGALVVLGTIGIIKFRKNNF